MTDIFKSTDTGPCSPDMEWIVQSRERETLFYGRNRVKEPLSLKSRIVHSIRKSCSLESWKRKLPISIWLPKYKLEYLRGDVVAGITVGMTTIPQALAYAQIAELPLEYGLYSSFVCCFVYTLLGTSKDLTLGVTSVVSLLTAEAMPEGASVYERTRYAILLAFLVGLCQMIMGALRLGVLFNFISHPVLSGFTTASAFIIMFGQIRNILGITGGSSTETVIQQATRYARNIHRIKGWDILVGMLCISALLYLREIKVPKKTRYGKVVTETFRLIIAARYGVIVIFATIAGYVLTYHDIKALTLTADVNSALPPLAFPDLNWNNVTFVEHVKVIAPTLPFIVLISAMETIAIAKAFSDRNSYLIDPTQELIAIGVSNFLTAFVSGYPITGSFTKSSLNAQSGVRTPLGCIFTASFVILSQYAISGAFKFVPKAALGAVIVVAVLVLFDLKLFKELWHTSRLELIPLIGTVICSMYFGLEVGFVVGIVASLLLVLISLTKPDLKLDCEKITYVSQSNASMTRNVKNIHVTPEGNLFFPAMENLKTFLNRKVFPVERKHRRRRNDKSKNIPLDPLFEHPREECILVFHGTDLRRLDFTTLTSLHSVIDQYMTMGYHMKFVDTPNRILEIVVPKTLRNIPEDVLSEDLVTLEIPPLQKCRPPSMHITVESEEAQSHDENDGLDEESPMARRLSAVTSNLE